MKKEIAAGSLLLLLILGAIVNLFFLKGFVGGLSDQVDASREACRQGDFQKAESLLRGAIEDWHGAEGYTHILIRHSEIDSTQDAFYELLSDVISEDEKSAEGAYEKLLSHIGGLYTMERVTLGSIF